MTDGAKKRKSISRPRDGGPEKMQRREEAHNSDAEGGSTGDDLSDDDGTSGNVSNVYLPSRRRLTRSPELYYV
jgi:hypothetical protein